MTKMFGRGTDQRRCMVANRQPGLAGMCLAVAGALGIASRLGLDAIMLIFPTLMSS